MLLTCRMWGSERRDSKANRREDDGGDEGQRHRTSTVCAQQTGNDWGRPGGLARQHDLLTLRELGHGSSIASTSILWKITSTWKFMMLKFDASSFHTDLPPPPFCKRGNMCKGWDSTSRTFVSVCQNVPGAHPVSERILCSLWKFWLWSVLLQRIGDRRVVKEVTDDTFGSLRHLLYSFSSPHQKRSAVYQSYYIHINGQTRAGNQFVVNKFSTQVLLFNCPFVVGFLYCRNKCRWAGHHSSGTKPN